MWKRIGNKLFRNWKKIWKSGNELKKNWFKIGKCEKWMEMIADELPTNDLK